MLAAAIPLAISAYSAWSNSKKDSGGSSKPQQITNYTPEQTKFLNQYLSQLKGMKGGVNQATGLLQQYMDPESDVYKNFEEPYMRAFQEQTIPGIAERFGGMGATGGGLSSSGFAQSLSAAGANLQTNLAAMKSQMQRSAINDFLGQYNNMSSVGLGSQPFSYTQQDKGAGFNGGLSQGLSAALPGLMQGAMTYFSGGGAGGGGFSQGGGG